MRYSCEVFVDVPRTRMLELLMNRANDLKWRPDLVLCEQIGEEPGWPGAETRLVYSHPAGGSIERVEHVTVNRLPDELRLCIVSPLIEESQLHRFTERAVGGTQWLLVSDVVFRHAGLMLRRHAGTLEEETRRAIESFKSFAEQHESRRMVGGARF